MKSKKILALILVLSTTSALSFSSMAEEVSLLDSLPAVQYEVETRGNAVEPGYRMPDNGVPDNSRGLLQEYRFP